MMRVLFLFMSLFLRVLQHNRGFRTAKKNNLAKILLYLAKSNTDLAKK